MHLHSLDSLTETSVDAILQRASTFKKGGIEPTCRGTTVAAVFLNPSLRTRTTLRIAAHKLGALAVDVGPGSGTWPLEFRDGAVMDGEALEHAAEAVRILSRYVDAICVRAFGDYGNFASYIDEPELSAFLQYATVPVVNLNSALYHPSQGLADLLTIREQLPDPVGRSFTLTWVPNNEQRGWGPCHSALHAAALAGMNISIAHPEGYELHDPVIDRIRERSLNTGATFTLGHDQRPAVGSADVVYAKNWTARRNFGNPRRHLEESATLQDWHLRVRDLRPTARLMHCLPVRRNVELLDEVLDSDRCVVIDQAENRLWVAAAVLERVLRN